MTDDPEQVAEGEPDLLRMTPEAIKFRTKRSQQRLAGRTDFELIGEVDAVPAPHFVNPMEMNRRLKDAISDLTDEVKAARVSADRLGWILVGLTIILIILTAALVVLTIKLASGTH